MIDYAQGCIMPFNLARLFIILFQPERDFLMQKTMSFERKKFMSHIINIRENPEWLEKAASYFSARWGVDKQLYADSMTDSLSTANPVPRWYLMLRGDEIIGGYGLIENDFMVRDDLCPWLCALYVEPVERGQHLGAQMLEHSRYEAAKLGYDKLYLNTDHAGYYEKYDWRYMGDFAHMSGDETRVYEADAASLLEEMGEFFNVRTDIYDSHMIDNLGLAEFYTAIADCIDAPVNNLLDLGCGTGLELEGLFHKYPNMEVTGIDMAGEMLKKLKDKFPGKKLRLICGSYFDVDFDGVYDCVLSTYSLHHFCEESKLDLYKKVYSALKPGGTFVLGDYTVDTLQRQHELAAINDAKRRILGIKEAVICHFDTPFTAKVEMRLMKAAGFAATEVVKQWDSTSIIVAKK